VFGNFARHTSNTYKGPFAMISSAVTVRNIDIGAPIFQKTVSNLSNRYVVGSQHTNGITKHEDFIELFEASSELYKTEFSDLWDNYVPLYNSIWRQDTRPAPVAENIHQDENVYHFGSGGYGSQMVNLWICLQKTLPAELGADELGIYVVKTGTPENDKLYSKLIAADSHFASLRPGQLTDNTFLAGPSVRFDPSKLQRTPFPYSAGTSICFNSHLLHGTQEMKAQPKASGFRTALTSVWVHRAHFHFPMLNLEEDSYETVFLKDQAGVLACDIREYFPEHYLKSVRSIKYIASLARHHLQLRPDH
jgi:hypothetical protein